MGNDDFVADDVVVEELEEVCKVYDSDDFFTVAVQLMLAAAALLSLWFKRHYERPRRKFRTWFLDVSKQGIGACYAHVCNMVSCFILDSFVSRYRFHHQPLTFVYQTLYCFTQLPAVKKRLLAVKIIREFDTVRPPYWALSEKYLAIPEENFRPEANWEPDEDYLIHLLGRLVLRIDAIGPDREFDSLNLDWRYMEFTNSVNLTVFASCIEVMTLPCSIQKVTDSLIDLLVKPDSPIPVDDIPKVVFLLV